MKKYKKIYVEITNNCNLSCDFCTHNKRKERFIKESEFEKVLEKIKNYTDYIYLHVLGEPLLHPDINKLIDLASNNFKINITTNGYLINRIKDNKNIRQINISLHSFNTGSLDDYMNNIFDSIDILKEHTYISLRVWVKNNHIKDIIKSINERYKKNIDYKNIENETKLDKNIFINTHEEFIWPSLNNDLKIENGTCYALRDHIAILVDGTVVPCCLDGDGVIKLGNIYKDDMKDIIESKVYNNMLNGFKNNKKEEELCKHCNFIK